jgi:hypothetical protein
MTSGRSVSWAVVAPKLPAPVADAYWSEKSSTETSVVPRLKIST